MSEIYDPLRKCNVARTPEEEVRQWFIALLRDTFKVPEHMMNSEVGFKFGDKQYRADILAFDRNGSPLLIIECKRPDVRIDQKVCEQAMRYNAVLSVRFIILTNGSTTFAFKRIGSGFAPIPSIPSYEEMLCQQ